MLIRDMIRRKCLTTVQIADAAKMLLNAVNVLLGIFVLTYACLVAKAPHLNRGGRP